MNHQMAATHAPLLEGVLHKVVEVTNVIAHASEQRAKEHWDMLAPAITALHFLLKTVYSQHPDLDPLAKAQSPIELGPDGFPRLPDAVPEAERLTAAEAFRLARRNLDEAYAELDQAAVALTRAEDIDEQERASLKAFCSQALDAIRTVASR